MRISDLRQRLQQLGAKPCHVDRLLRGWSRLCSYDRKGSPAAEFFPKALRDELPSIEADLNGLARLASEHPAGEGVARLLVELHDGQMVESVLLPRGGLCVSTQVGCAVGCVFCMSGRGGLLRQLGSAEIAAQVVLARRRREVGKVVFMGMGEPAHNLDNVLEAIQLLGTQGNICHKNLVLSTVGDLRVFDRLMEGLKHSPIPPLTPPLKGGESIGLQRGESSQVFHPPFQGDVLGLSSPHAQPLTVSHPPFQGDIRGLSSQHTQPLTVSHHPFQGDIRGLSSPHAQPLPVSHPPFQGDIRGLSSPHAQPLPVSHPPFQGDVRGLSSPHAQPLTVSHPPFHGDVWELSSPHAQPLPVSHPPFQVDIRGLSSQHAQPLPVSHPPFQGDIRGLSSQHTQPLPVSHPPFQGEGRGGDGVADGHVGTVRPALALSLHTTDAELRAKLLPNAPRIPIEELVERAEVYARATSYPVQYQWTLIEGVNDNDAEVARIAELLAGKYAVLNYIPFNEVDGLEYRRPSDERIASIVQSLKQRGILAKVRDSAGQEIEGACGQLRARAVNAIKVRKAI